MIKFYLFKTDRQVTGRKSSLSRGDKINKGKHSSDKFFNVLNNSGSKRHKKTRNFRNVKIAMKSQNIQRRTILNLKQAKLMSHIIRQKLSREKFMRIIDKVPRTAKRDKLVNLLYTPKNIMRSVTKIPIHTTQEEPKKNCLPDIEEELDFSNEVKQILQEYSNLQRKAMQKKATSTYLDSVQTIDLKSRCKSSCTKFNLLILNSYFYSKRTKSSLYYKENDCKV